MRNKACSGIGVGSNVSRGSPVAASHKRRPSEPSDVARVWPSGDSAIASNCALGRSNTRKSRSALRGQQPPDEVMQWGLARPDKLVEDLLARSI